MDNKVKITVQLNASLIKFAKNGSRTFTCELLGSPTVKKLINELKIPEEEVALITINNKKAKIDSKLQSGDNVALFPFIGGG